MQKIPEIGDFLLFFAVFAHLYFIYIKLKLYVVCVLGLVLDLLVNIIKTIMKLFSLRKAVYTVAATAGFLSFGMTAFAGVAVSVGPNFPTPQTVGQSNVPVSMTITNNSSAGDGNPLTINSIKLIPSCGTITGGACTSLDPGVFHVDAAGTGAGACAANTFTIAETNVSSGEVTFTPNATIALAPGAVCTINFTVDVVGTPDIDATGAAGLQTLQLGSVDGIDQLQQPGSGTGSDTTTIVPRGHIIVDKVTFPAGDPQNFSFVATGTGYTNFALTDIATPNNQELDAGTYAISETLPAGWTQTSATCVSSIQDTETIGNLELDANETITCTFTNTKKGHIIVNKVTNPAADPQEFNFAATGAGYNSFVLTDVAAPNNQEVVPGSYTVSENAVTGWVSDGGVCDNGETPASLDVGAGETVTCTFTNTKQGRIIVDKITNPSGDPQSFNFVATGTGYTSFALTDVAAPNSQVVAPGAYAVSETAVTGWTSDGGVCDNGETPASLDVGAGETVTCTFTNTLQKGHLIVQKTTLPSSTTTVFSILATGTGTITGGGAGTTTDVVDRDYEVTPGTYSVSETLPAGWTQTGNTCNNVTVAPGETKTCVITNTQVAQYCSPGYWKQPQHFDSYVTYSPNATFLSVFGVNAFPGMTLVQVLSNGGGGLDAYGRKAVGALLNASALNSGLTPAQVISKFVATYNAAPSGKAANSYYGGANPEFTAPEMCPLN